MSYSQKYIDQVTLLLKVLPLLRGQSVFSVKGGTAINFFEHDMPRLSVDIDLAFTQMQDRASSIEKMQQTLKTLASQINKRFPDILIKKKFSADNKYIVRLFIHHNRTMIKVEPNYVMRGVLFPVELKAVNKLVSDYFSLYVDDIPVSSKADLYAGKLCAALSRQHPRDLFDIKILLATGGIDDKLLDAFTVYLSCDQRPMHELLRPNFKDISQPYNNEFLQMTTAAVSLESLYAAREALILTLSCGLTDNQKTFLLSVAEGEPWYHLLPFEDLHKLPGLAWKVLNVNKMGREKKIQMIHKLEQALNG